MNTTEIKVKDFSHREIIGSLEWVKGCLDGETLGLFNDVNDSSLCLIKYNGGDDELPRWETIIAKEVKSANEKNPFQSERSYMSGATIRGCYAFNEDKSKESLFSFSLTPAAQIYVEQFIKKCMDLLNDAIQKRDFRERELVDLEVFKIQYTPIREVNCIKAAHAGGEEYTWEIPNQLINIQDGDLLLVETRENFGTTVVKAVGTPFIVTEDYYNNNICSYRCKVLENLGQSNKY